MPAAALINANAVFTALTLRKPMPWQRKWLKMLTASDPSKWPDQCAIPTGLGKTMTIPMLVIAMGFVDGAPRRIVYTVNRRRVVDQTYAEILRLRHRLIHRNDPSVVTRSADREVLNTFVSAYKRNMGLIISKTMHPMANQAISADLDRLLEIYILRGDLEEPIERFRSPLMPTVVLSTLDQAGSRILFFFFF